MLHGIFTAGYSAICGNPLFRKELSRWRLYFSDDSRHFITSLARHVNSDFDT
jgi:hypothetical protein